MNTREDNIKIFRTNGNRRHIWKISELYTYTYPKCAEGPKTVGIVVFGGLLSDIY